MPSVWMCSSVETKFRLLHPSLGSRPLFSYVVPRVMTRVMWLPLFQNQNAKISLNSVRAYN